ncbi:uncharacterized protein LOC122945559 [Bufo gargarizans]|uniref:uncharacterized protein LOC122945559 n=1 Tax=Bufo gargarizans TaxID=30331 RepID=UPI001CF3524C|nr:uncharacterized protein LOC122945559 [Bufo gargarizans]
MFQFVCSFLQKVHEYFKICILTILNAESFTVSDVSSSPVECGQPSFSQRVVGVQIAYRHEENAEAMRIEDVRSDRRRPCPPRLGKAVPPCLGKAVPPHLGKAVHPSLGKAVHPRLGKAVHPRLGKAVHPRLGKAVHPRLGKAVHPFLGKAVHPLLGKAVPPRLGKAVHLLLGKAVPLRLGKAAHPRLGKAVHPLLGKAVHPRLGKAVHPLLGKAVPPRLGKAVHLLLGKAVPPRLGKAVHSRLGEAVPLRLGEAVHPRLGEAVPPPPREGRAPPPRKGRAPPPRKGRTSPTRVIVPVKTTIMHPIYSGDGSSGDLALLELERPVTFNNYIQPICLPDPDQLFPDGMMCWVTGWGNIMEGVSLALPYILQEVELPLINSSACDHMFKAAYNITAAMSVVQDDMICAGYQEGKKDSCQGDSGGPLACQFGSSWFLVGVVSWGDGCARPGEPGVYTKVSSFSAWIQENAHMDPTSEGTINVTVHVNTFSTKKPTAAAQSFFSSKNIQEDTSGAAGQMPLVGAAGLMLLIFLVRTLDIIRHGPDRGFDVTGPKHPAGFGRIRAEFFLVPMNEAQNSISSLKKRGIVLPVFGASYCSGGVCSDDACCHLRSPCPPAASRKHKGQKTVGLRASTIKDLSTTTEGPRVQHVLPYRGYSESAAWTMNTPNPRNRAQHLHGQGPPISRRTTAAVLLLVLGILMKTAPGSAQLSSLQRVVGGQDAAPREWPWQAALLYENASVCGGSLISQDWVVTAAHCVVGKTHRKLQVLLGVLNLMDTGSTRLSVAVKKVIINPIYNGGITSGDLALLQLEMPVNFNDNIQPITLPSQDQEFQNGMMCWLTGWGYTAENVPQTAPHTLQKVELPLINSTNCDKMFQVAFNASHAPDLVKEDMICAGYPEGKKDGCQGDSGGPLACPSHESWFLVGIMSWGEGCAQPQKPGVFTKVSRFSSWIQERTGATTISKLKTTAATTENMNTVITQYLKVESQALTLSKVTNQETTSAGRRLQISISLFVMVIAFTAIVDVAREAFLCL